MINDALAGRKHTYWTYWTGGIYRVTKVNKSWMICEFHKPHGWIGCKVIDYHPRDLFKKQITKEELFLEML